MSPARRSEVMATCGSNDWRRCLILYKVESMHIGFAVFVRRPSDGRKQ